MLNNSVADEQSGQCADGIVQHFKEVYPLEQWKMEGFFEDDDVLDIIDCHWMAFEPVRPSVHFLFAIVYIVVFLVGFFSNSLVIFVISR